MDSEIGIIIERDKEGEIKSIFKGQLINKKADGYGYYKDDYEEYEGQWTNNQKNGIGEIIYVDQSSYKGEFLNGKRNGIGEYKWSDNSYYRGEFKNNNMNGLGICKNANNVVFMGNFCNGLLNGYGEIKKPNGTSYFGGFIQGKKNGYGILLNYSSSIKTIFFGFFKDNMMNGFGKKATKNTETYGYWNMGCQQEKYEENEFYKILENKGLQKYCRNFSMTYSEFDAIYILDLNN